MNIDKDVDLFIEKIKADSSYREIFYKFKNENEISSYLKENGFNFAYHDFDDIISKKLASCQYEEIGLELEEIKNWWKFLLI